MCRTEALQYVCMIGFRSVLERHEAAELNQIEAGVVGEENTASTFRQLMDVCRGSPYFHTPGQVVRSIARTDRGRAGTGVSGCRACRRRGAERHRIENAFCRLKDFRRVFTNYDRLARNFLASVCLAAAMAWWI
jgi:hypothetical protein